MPDVSKRYSIGLGDGWIKAHEDMRKRLSDDFANKIMRQCGADTIENLRINTDFSNGVSYATHMDIFV